MAWLSPWINQNRGCPQDEILSLLIWNLLVNSWQTYLRRLGYWLCRFRLFGSPCLVSMSELSSIVIKDTASFIKLSGWFPAQGGGHAFNLPPLRWLTCSMGLMDFARYRACAYLWRHNGLCSLVIKTATST